MFGELGILLNKPRSATVLAGSDCHLAVIDSNNYKQILKQAEVKKF